MLPPTEIEPRSAMMRPPGVPNACPQAHWGWSPDVVRLASPVVMVEPRMSRPAATLPRSAFTFLVELPSPFLAKK